MENLKGKNTWESESPAWESESPERKMLYDFYTMDRISFDTENFEEYDEDEQLRNKKILKFANVAVEAAKRKGISKEKIMEEANRSARHRMPGETLKETQIGFATTNKASSEE